MRNTILSSPNERVAFPFLQDAEPILLRTVRPDMERWLSDDLLAQLRRKRKALGLTQAQLGALFGLSRTMVFEWEAGRIALPKRVQNLISADGWSGRSLPKDVFRSDNAGAKPILP